VRSRPSLCFAIHSWVQPVIRSGFDVKPAEPADPPEPPARKVVGSIGGGSELVSIARAAAGPWCGRFFVPLFHTAVSHWIQWLLVDHWRSLLQPLCVSRRPGCESHSTPASIELGPSVRSTAARLRSVTAWRRFPCPCDWRDERRAYAKLKQRNWRGPGHGNARRLSRSRYSFVWRAGGLWQQGGQACTES
jgi:hypothetical protein